MESHLPGPWLFSPSNHGRSLVRERWESGRLIELCIRRAAEEDHGEIVITYVGGPRHGAPAREVRFENGIHGYRIDIAVAAYEPLTCDE